MRVSARKFFNMVTWAALMGSLGPAVLEAQDCGCNVVVAATTTSVNGDTVARVGGGSGIQPGDKVCLMAGSTPKLTLKIENLEGSAAAPVLITNCGGRVIIGSESATPVEGQTGVLVKSSRHFVFSGKGEPAHEYGIYIRGTVSGSGLDLRVQSEHFRVKNLEISHTSFAGIFSKTDPDCGSPANRGFWTQHETYYDHNYIHDTGGEGLYIGSTAYDTGLTRDCDKDGIPETTVYPHDVVGVGITDNRVERTGWDGIQLGSATEDAEITGNVVDGFGLTHGGVQTNGIHIGDGTTGLVAGNVVKDGRGNGIFMGGHGDNVVINNLILRADGEGIYVRNNGADPGEGFFFYNNTIVSPGRRGLTNFNQDAVGSEAYNNIVAGPNRLATTSDPCMYVDSGADMDLSDNLCADDPTEVAALEFANAAADDYRLGAGSPAIDGGIDLTADGVTVDLDGVARPQGAAFDIGAYERPSNPGGGDVVFQQDFESSSSLASYVNATAPSTGQLNDVSAQADGGAWSIQDGELRLVREGLSTAANNAGITRHTDFAGPPTLLHATFDVGVSDWTASQFQSNALTISVGNLAAFLDYGSGGVAANNFQTVSVNGDGPGLFTVSTAGAESAPLDADGALHRVALFLNKSGAAAGYRAPDGTLRSLRANGVALWVGTAAVVVDGAATNGSSSALTDLRLLWSHPEDATWTLDNFVIRKSFPQ